MSGGGAHIAEAAERLRRGQLVAFPTETVYGLGAAAEQPQALDRLYSLKGRPRSHPVIVHGSDAAILERYARDRDPRADALAQAFWPGPLTLIVLRSDVVPDEVTGGQDTVGLRVPRHPVALALLSRFGGGVAAPSANRFGRVSPTSADDVRADLGTDVFVLDGGQTDVGIESTVLDLSGASPSVLRPGGVTVEDVEEVIGVRPVPPRETSPRAPGTLDAHYAPGARVELVGSEQVASRAAALERRGERVVVIAPSQTPRPVAQITLIEFSDATEFARGLYGALRAADRADADAILAVPPQGDGLAAAVRDRLERASGVRREPVDA